MNWLAKSSLSLRWTLRCVEWTLLVMEIAIAVADGEVIVPYQLAAFNVTFFLLSFIFPSDRPLWQRRTYIAIEMLLIITANALGLGLGSLLYFFLFKSCILLSRRDVVLTVIATGVAHIFSLAWSLPWLLPQLLEHIRSRGLENYFVPEQILINTLFQYLGLSTFVILLGFVMVAESQSRQRAEALTKEVEKLAANLERTRIARDIHDSLGHTLTTLDIQLEVAQKLRQHDPEKALEALDTAKYLASQCLQDVRLALQTMRQSDFNLNEALNRLVAQFNQSRLFKIKLDINLPQLPLQTSHQIYCILQEGITNIHKHAGATYVNLRGWFTDELIVLMLTDDGKGFNSEQVNSGFGLRGMQERVQMLGGKLKIDSAPGEGTQIQVIIPK
jgi:signal transduction histidine kinase